MAGISYAQRIGILQGAIGSLLESRGFAVYGLLYTRTTEDCLTQVVDIQVYPRNLPFAGWENYDARFTVNLGVCVPEVEKYYGDPRLNARIKEPQCCIHRRLGRASGYDKDLWWPICFRRVDIEDVLHRLENGGLRFLDQYSTRDKILRTWNRCEAVKGINIVPVQIVKAIIHCERGEKDLARELFAQYVKEITMPAHEAFIRKVAKRAGIWNLEAELKRICAKGGSGSSARRKKRG